MNHKNCRGCNYRHRSGTATTLLDYPVDYDYSCKHPDVLLQNKGGKAIKACYFETPDWCPLIGLRVIAIPPRPRKVPWLKW